MKRGKEVSLKDFAIGIDSYCLSPLAMSPFEVLDWTHRNGGRGVQFSEVHLKPGCELDEGLCREIAAHARNLDLYLEWGGGRHIPREMSDFSRLDVLPWIEKASKEARTLGAKIVRSCSGGLMRWRDDAPSTETLLQETADALVRARPILEEAGVTLALEIHFEFTTVELLRLFDSCGARPGGFRGICLDTMNLLTLLEDPVEGTRRILPWVVCTHVKDGAMAWSDRGLVSFPTALGEGLIDLGAVVELLSELERPIHLSVEDHGGSFDLPIFDAAFLSRFPDLTARELAGLCRMARDGDQRLNQRRLAITDRGNWPALCQARTARDMKRLQALVRAAERGDPGEKDGAHGP